MNRYQRLMKEAHETAGLLEDEFNALKRKLTEVTAENKRLRFSIYGKQPQTFAEAVKKAHLQCSALPHLTTEQAFVEVRAGFESLLDESYPRIRDGEKLTIPLRTKVDSYFDVTKWVWVSEAVIPYAVTQ